MRLLLLPFGRSWAEFGALVLDVVLSRFALFSHVENMPGHARGYASHAAPDCSVSERVLSTGPGRASPPVALRSRGARSRRRREPAGPAFPPHRSGGRLRLLPPSTGPRCR